jgi:isoleucyl-tRNA synthetase
MDTFHLYKATQHYQPFLADLSKWYIRRSRKRFADGDMNALSVLYTVLKDFVRLLAPFMPFVSEAIFKNLETSGQKSVHLTDYPIVNSTNRDADLEEAMVLVRDIVEAGHRVRKEQSLKVRQPLTSVTATVIPQQQSLFEKPYKEALLEIIADELNVKAVMFAQKESGTIPDVYFDLIITDALRKEGIAREIIRHIQNMRKEQKMELQATITVLLFGEQSIQDAVAEHKAMIGEQIKADSIEFVDGLEGEIIKIDKELVVTVKIACS